MKSQRAKDGRGANEHITGIERLTQSEAAILEQLARGDTNADIARARGRSIRTVAKQVSTVMAKLEVTSRRQLLAVLRKAYACVGTARSTPLILHTAKRKPLLTEREQAVVQRAMQGESNKEISFDLLVSTSTVAVLLSRGVHKLGVGSLAELMLRRDGPDRPA